MTREGIDNLSKALAGQHVEIADLRGEIERLQASLKMTNGGERELSAFLKQEAEVKRLRTGIDRIVGLCLSDAGIGKIHARLVALLAAQEPKP